MTGYGSYGRSEKDIRIWLKSLYGQGVEIYLQGNDLKVISPRGTLTGGIRDEIKRRKPEIIKALDVSQIRFTKIESKRGSITTWMPKF